MKVSKAEFIGSFSSLGQMPQRGLPEIAFVGRSNVGKSSLLNKLLGVRKLAKISSKPGKTRNLNLFRVNESVHFVDLPGYGFAQVSKSERQSWKQMIEGYLLGSEYLRLLIVLIDARHGALDNDRQMLDWLDETGLPHLPVLTKADKVPKNRLASERRKMAEPSHYLYGALFCSAETGLGIKEIWQAVDEVLAGCSNNES